MGPLSTRQRRRRDRWAPRAGRLDPGLDALLAKAPYARPPMLSPAPVTPEEGRSANHGRMPQQTDPAGFCRLVAVPLTLRTHRAGAAVDNPGGVEHPQRASVLGTLFGWMQRLADGAAECPVRLESKVRSCEAPSFPGGSDGGRAIPRCESR